MKPMFKISIPSAPKRKRKQWEQIVTKALQKAGYESEVKKQVSEQLRDQILKP